MKQLLSVPQFCTEYAERFVKKIRFSTTSTRHELTYENGNLKRPEKRPYHGVPLTIPTKGKVVLYVLMDYNHRYGKYLTAFVYSMTVDGKVRDDVYGDPLPDFFSLEPDCEGYGLNITNPLTNDVVSYIEFDTDDGDTYGTLLSTVHVNVVTSNFEPLNTLVRPFHYGKYATQYAWNMPKPRSDDDGIVMRIGSYPEIKAKGLCIGDIIIEGKVITVFRGSVVEPVKITKCPVCEGDVVPLGGQLRCLNPEHMKHVPKHEPESPDLDLMMEMSMFLTSDKALELIKEKPAFSNVVKILSDKKGLLESFKEAESEMADMLEGLKVSLDDLPKTDAVNIPQTLKGKAFNPSFGSNVLDTTIKILITGYGGTVSTHGTKIDMTNLETVLNEMFKENKDESDK